MRLHSMSREAVPTGAPAFPGSVSSVPQAGLGADRLGARPSATADGALKRIRPHKLASSTVGVGLSEVVRLVPPQSHRIGDLAAVRVLEGQPAGNLLELRDGRFSRMAFGDIVVGVLGERRALKGSVGIVPAELEIGDRLHLLNLGGVVGLCTGYHQAASPPTAVELLGLVAAEGRVVNLQHSAIPLREELEGEAPLVIVAGSCMNSGKTQAAAAIIHGFCRGGSRVAAAKLSGVAALRDLLEMRDRGAVEALSFLDCGFPSTVGLRDLSPLARTLISRLNRSDPEVIVLEMGDGLLGLYEVESVFLDRMVMERCSAVVFCASDLVGAWGGQRLLRDRGIEVDLFSGSVTDSPLGCEFLSQRLGVPAANSLQQGPKLYEVVSSKVWQWRNSR